MRSKMWQERRIGGLHRGQERREEGARQFIARKWQAARRPCTDTVLHGMGWRLGDDTREDRDESARFGRHQFPQSSITCTRRSVYVWMEVDETQYAESKRTCSTAESGAREMYYIYVLTSPVAPSHFEDIKRQAVTKLFNSQISLTLKYNATRRLEHTVHTAH